MSRWSRSTTCPTVPAPRRARSAISRASWKRWKPIIAYDARRMKFSIEDIAGYERDVKLRMPFRFGVVTLTAAPQAFVRARIRLENGTQAEGAAAELLVPKWFDKNPALSNEDNFEQLRASLRTARDAYLANGSRTAYGHSRPRIGLVENFGPALIDRALLDALCRAAGVSRSEEHTSELQS